MDSAFLINPLELGADLLSVVLPPETIIGWRFTGQRVENTLPQGDYDPLTLDNIFVQLANQGELREKYKLASHDYIYWFGVPNYKNFMPNNRNELTGGDYITRPYAAGKESLYYIIKDISVTSGTFMTLYAVESAQQPGVQKILDAADISPVLPIYE